MERAERGKVNDFEMKCLRSLMGVSRIYRVRKRELSRTAGTDRGLAISVDQRVFRR